MRRIIGIGETVLDIIFREDQPQKAVPGGSTFNAMISLGRMLQHLPEVERPTASMITETGDDHIGKIITDFMQANHVLTDFVTINSGTQSHLSLAFLDNESNAQYEFYKDHAAARLDASKVKVNFTSSDLVLFGSFFAINPVLRDYTYNLFSAANKAGAILYYDINFRKSHIKDIPKVIRNIEENIGLSTIVRGSAEDFGYLYGTTDAREIYERYIKPLCPVFICTDGPKPVRIFSYGNEVSVPAERLDNVVSTIGAGDNFNAGFLYGLIRKDLSLADFVSLSASSLAELAKTAQQFSAHVCMRLDNYVEETFLI